MKTAEELEADIEKWLEETDIFQFSIHELLLMYASKIQREIYNQALEDKRKLLIDFIEECLHDLIDAENGGIKLELIVNDYLEKLKK